MNLTIGSGSATKFLSGTQTKGFKDLLRFFVSEDKPYWNSFASPINALRTGAILELRYHYDLDEDYYSQHKSQSKDFDCLVSSLDFAKIEKGEVVDFDELKTIFLTDYIETIVPLKNSSPEEQKKILLKKFKSNYVQIQFQMYCASLDSANLVFLSVESYNDDENYLREIKENDYVKIRVKRDTDIIKRIEERAYFFQRIKDFINEH